MDVINLPLPLSLDNSEYYIGFTVQFVRGGKDDDHEIINLWHEATNTKCNWLIDVFSEEIKQSINMVEE